MRCRTLDVWKRSCRLSVEIHRYFDNSRHYSFKDQITRSSLSVASNIAEGVEKDSLKERNRFIEIARGSAAELMTQIYIGIETDYIERKTGFAWIREIEELSKMLIGLKNRYTKETHAPTS